MLIAEGVAANREHDDRLLMCRCATGRQHTSHLVFATRGPWSWRLWVASTRLRVVPMGTAQAEARTRALGRNRRVPSDRATIFTKR